MVPPGIRAIFFDAVGTLIHPEPPAHLVYAAVGRRWGSHLTTEEVRDRFRAAFAQEEAEDRRLGLRTSEAREAERWRRIVAAVLDEVTDPEVCFEELWQHFARPEGWRCTAKAAAVLPELVRRGYRLGLASNYDHRLRSVVAGLPELQAIRDLVISSEVGWRKPAPEFFAALCRSVALPPSQVLLVGDDLVNDFEGGRASGLAVLFFDPAGHGPPLVGPRLASLRELLS